MYLVDIISGSVDMFHHTEVFLSLSQFTQQILNQNLFRVISTSSFPSPHYPNKNVRYYKVNLILIYLNVTVKGELPEIVTPTRYLDTLLGYIVTWTRFELRQ